MRILRQLMLNIKNKNLKLKKQTLKCDVSNITVLPVKFQYILNHDNYFKRKKLNNERFGLKQYYLHFISPN